MLVKVLSIASLMLANFAAGQNSPCPDVFRYALNASSLYFGVVTAPSPQLGTVGTMEILLSLPIPLQNSYYGSIDVMADQSHLIDKIVLGKTIRYRVEFPTQEPLATVTSILQNGRSICEGPKDPNSQTEIHLKHTLTTHQTLTTKKLRVYSKFPPFPSKSFGADFNSVEPLQRDKPEFVKFNQVNLNFLKQIAGTSSQR